MKKRPVNSADDQDTIAALMTLIAEGIRNADKVKDSGALRDWLELGCSALEKFGGDAVLDDPEFRQVLENNSISLKKPGEDRQPLLLSEENLAADAAAPVLNSFVLFCDIVIAGNDCAVALKYNEENMFSPMVVLLEKNASAGALVRAAENLGVPVVKNLMLAKNLVSYGKAGENIPDASSRDVLLLFTRLNSARPQWRSRIPKTRRDSSAKASQPLLLELGESVYALTGEEPGREKLLAEPLNAIRKKLSALLGFAVPVFRISRSSRLKDDEYRILFRGLEAGRGRLELGWYALNRNFSEGADPRIKRQPGPKGGASRIVEGSGGVFLAQAALQGNPRAAVPDMMKNPENIHNAAKAASSVLIRHVHTIIQKRAPELLGRDEVEAILHAAEEKYPVVTGEVKSLLSLGIIREILQSLVSEQVSIRHISIILETLADWGSFGSAPCETIIEQIRQSLKRQICLDYADDRMNLRVLNLKPDLEKKFADHSPLIMADADKNDSPETGENEYLVDLISGAVEGMEDKKLQPVILCSPKVRSIVKEATRWKLPDLAVLSYLEIPSDINVVPIGEIGLEGNIRFSSVFGSPPPGPESGSAGSLRVSDPADKLG